MGLALGQMQVSIAPTRQQQMHLKNEAQRTPLNGIVHRAPENSKQWKNNYKRS
jgi:hypothetical protein